MPTPAKALSLSSAGRPLCAGLDIGSLSCEAVILQAGGPILGWSILPTGARSRASAEQALDQALELMKAGHGTQFDPDVVDVFARIILRR